MKLDRKKAQRAQKAPALHTSKAQRFALHTVFAITLIVGMAMLWGQPGLIFFDAPVAHSWGNSQDEMFAVAWRPLDRWVGAAYARAASGDAGAVDMEDDVDAQRSALHSAPSPLFLPSLSSGEQEGSDANDENDVPQQPEPDDSNPPSFLPWHGGHSIEESEVDDANTGTTYYVDCAEGNDASAGTSQANAWQTLARVNAVALGPGDRVLFKRDCSWTGPLDASWHGTAARPILIGAYGAGALPKIQDAYTTNVRITGRHLIIDSLHATLSTPPNPDPNCQNQPVAWKAGFVFQGDASYNTVQNSHATHLAIGIFFHGDSSHNRALFNTITNNHVLWELKPNRSLGAMGVLLQGDHQVVGHNFFTDNRSLCTYTGVAESNSIELYAARNALIHHNVSLHDRVFSEMGSSPTRRSENNTYAFNLHVAGDDNSVATARFLVTRGWQHAHGPVLNTHVYHNTVYLTDKESKGVTCGMCGNGILTLKNNVLWVDREPVWSDGPFVEEGNLYWSTDGRPLVLFENTFMHSKSMIADPQFADPANGQFNLRANSPAIGMGATLAPDVLRLDYDLEQTILSRDGAPDAGAYQFRAAAWQRVFPLPGRIQAQHYRDGGPGVGYDDTTPGNSGRAYRDDDVDIEVTQDSSGDYNIGWIAAGEWLAYDVQVTTTGMYRIAARVATPSGGRRLRLELDGVDAQRSALHGQNISGSVLIPWTGGWQNWTDVVMTAPLRAGRYTLRVIAENERFNLNYLHFTTVQ